MTEPDSDESDDGVGIPNLLCFNDHGNSGQVMENRENGGYECPVCGRRAGVSVQWKDPNQSSDPV